MCERLFQIARAFRHRPWSRILGRNHRLHIFRSIGDPTADETGDRSGKQLEEGEGPAEKRGADENGVDPGLGSADEKAHSRAGAGAVSAQAQSGGNHSARAQGKRHAQPYGFHDTESTAELPVHEARRKCDVENAGNHGTEQKPGRQLQTDSPHGLKHQRPPIRP